MSEDEITLDKITELLATLQDYIEHYMLDGREKDNVISKIAEAVFWVTYYDERLGE